MKLTRFQISGLFGDRGVTLPIADNALILVGPNGLGKSSVANIFYFTISRQWKRLLDYSFNRITLFFGNDELTFERDEVSGLLGLKELIESQSSRTGSLIRRLINHDFFEEFINSTKFTLSDRIKYSNVLNIPQTEVSMFQRQLLRRLAINDDVITTPRGQLEEKSASYVPNQVLYLPTYRRIERDFREVFPGIEERYRRLGEESRLESGRSGSFYTELVSFGMEDVKKSLAAVAQKMRDYS